MKNRTKIMISGDIYFGKWIPGGTRGVILGKKPDSECYWVLLEGDPKVYTLAPGEFVRAPKVFLKK